MKLLSLLKKSILILIHELINFKKKKIKKKILEKENQLIINPKLFKKV